MVINSSPHCIAGVLFGIASLVGHWSFAQTDTVHVFQSRVESIEERHDLPSSQIDPGRPEISPWTKRQRVLTVGVGHGVIFGGSLLLLNEAWYQGYPRSSFHFFNDNSEWLQIDKMGHVWSAYHQSRLSFESWQWAGLNRDKQMLMGGLSGVAFQGVIETLDAFSSQWGWSWGDFAANVAGSGLFVGQQLAWDEQRINFKLGFYSRMPIDEMLRRRSIELYGNTLAERMLKDYNGQTYWLSINMKSFMKESHIPS